MDPENRIETSAGCGDRPGNPRLLSEPERAALSEALTEPYVATDSQWAQASAAREDKTFPSALPRDLETRPSIHDRGLGKFLSTEFVVFVAIFLVSSVALFRGLTDFPWWLVGVLGSSVVCGTVRTVKHLRILGLEIDRCSCPDRPEGSE